MDILLKIVFPTMIEILAIETLSYELVVRCRVTCY